MRRKLGLRLTERKTTQTSACTRALTAATRRGHVAVLDWWVYNAGVALDAPYFVLYDASVLESQADDPTMLEWWFASGQLRQPPHDRQLVERCLTLASQKGHVQILECWRTLGSAYIPSILPIDLEAACIDNHVAVLDWWVTSGLPYQYSWRALETATKFGHIAVLDWWVQSGLRWEVPHDIGRVIVHSRSKAVVEWWARRGYCPLLSDTELAAAARDEEFDVLDYWAWMTPGLKSHDRDAELDFKVSLLVLEACAHGCVDVLEWLVTRGIPFRLGGEETDALQFSSGGHGFMKCH